MSFLSISGRPITVFRALLILGLPAAVSLPAAEGVMETALKPQVKAAGEISPAAESGAPGDRHAGELVIVVRQDGALVWNSKVLTEAQLISQLEEVARLDRKRAVIIRSDSRTKYEKIVRVLSITHAAGLYHVSFATTTSRE